MAVVDADGHIYEPEDLWTARMDHARWGDWIPRRVVEDGCYDVVYTGGVVRGGGRELQDRMAAAIKITIVEIRQILTMYRAVTTPIRARTYVMAGIWNTTPIASMTRIIKSK